MIKLHAIGILLHGRHYIQNIVMIDIFNDKFIKVNNNRTCDICNQVREYRYPVMDDYLITYKYFDVCCNCFIICKEKISSFIYISISLYHKFKGQLNCDVAGVIMQQYYMQMRK